MRGQLMRLFSREVHAEVLAAHACDKAAAVDYNLRLPLLSLTKVTRQNVGYWRRVFAEDGNMAKADRELIAKRSLKPAEPLVGNQRFDPGRMYKRILHIPDAHAPYQHQDALAFLVAVRDKYKPDLVVNAGDETDKHAMSFHDSDPNLDSAGAELERAKVMLAAMAREFPEQLLCDSNHGSMHYRKAKAHGIPVQYLKTYRDILFPQGGGDGWTWAESWRVRTALGDVLFKHQASGSVLVDAAHNQCNLMVGHNHGNFSVEYSASSERLYWGAYGGCLIDKDSLAFAYGKHTLRKPVLGCTMILRGMPVLIPMVLSSAGRWVGRL